MSALSDFLENELLDHVLRNSAYVPPATVYVALFTTPTTDAGGGTEVSGGSYARTAVTFAAAAGGACSNSGAVTFPTATVSWGTVTHLAVMDAAAAGNTLWQGPMAASKTVGIGDTFSLAIGQLTCSLA